MQFQSSPEIPSLARPFRLPWESSKLWKWLGQGRTCTSQQALDRAAQVIGLVDDVDGATVSVFLDPRDFKNRETYELPSRCPMLKEGMIIVATLPRIQSPSALAYIWRSPQTAASHTAV